MSDQTPSSAHPVPPSSGVVPPVQIQSLTPGGSTSSAVPIPAAPVIPAPATLSSAIPTIETAAYEEESYAPGYEHPAIHHAIAPGPKKNIFVQYWNKVGGGSFLISLIIHVGLLVGAFFIVSEYSAEKKVDFLPGGGSKEGQQASQQLAQKVQNKKRSTLNKTTPMRKVVSMSSTSAIALPEVPMDSIEMPEMSSLMGGSMGSGGFGTGGAGGGFGKGTGIGGNTGFVSLPPSMRSRCSSAERLQKLKESGGTAECERAVSNALEYLKSKQKADGSWGTNSKGAMTGFALLCYLGRCETPESIYYGDNVMKGILFLIEMQKKNPYKMFSQATSGNAPVYEHGIATYALGEMYTLARMGSKSLPGMREAFESGVQVIIDNQQASGSWVYDTEKGFYSPGREDLSVTGWQYQALKAAKLTSLKINGLSSSIDKTVKYLEGKQTKDGGIGGANREGGYNQWNLTGAGTL
ncbi:MAG: prenyltransferase/squalene oxidase repeat-containing protein, partial [Roseimicrobium sp.]